MREINLGLFSAVTQNANLKQQLIGEISKRKVRDMRRIQELEDLWLLLSFNQGGTAKRLGNDVPQLQ